MDETRTDRRGGSRNSLASRLLAPFADVRPEEATTALLMAGQVFVLLTVYYLLKPVRESWILPGGAELKTYLAALQAIALIGVAKGYDHLARKVRRDRLIAIAVGISSVCLVAFHALDAAGIDIGVAFYLWLGAFQLLLIAQFWSFATDLYTPEQGRRIFAILGAGAALGSVLGAQIARVLMRVVDRPSSLLLLAAALLLVAPIVASIVHARASRASREGDSPAPPVAMPTAESRRGVIARVLGDPYLRVVALFTVLLNWVSTVGEYALDRTLLESAALAVDAGDAVSVAQYVGAFKADYYAAINLLVLVLQLFAVSRVLKIGGERLALAVLPVFVVIGALASMGAIGAAIPLLAVLATQRVVENGIAHSIQSTARQGLYLVTTREGRWSGKAFIDTVTWRTGDVLGAVTVAALSATSASIVQVLGCALGLGVCWLFVVRAVGREHRARELSPGELSPGPSPGELSPGDRMSAAETAA